MSFGKYLKSVQLIEIGMKDVPIKKISCQYNDDRIHLYRQCIKNMHSDKPLSPYAMPHLNFLITAKVLGLQRFSKDDWTIARTSLYYKMHKLYGRDRKWITGKMQKFINLFIDIGTYGIKEPIVLLNKPIIKNIYNPNKYFEVWEGHHRLAIAAFSGATEVKAKICKWSSDEKL